MPLFIFENRIISVRPHRPHFSEVYITCTISASSLHLFCDPSPFLQNVLLINDTLQWRCWAGGHSGSWRMIIVVLHWRASVSIWWCLPQDKDLFPSGVEEQCAESVSLELFTIWQRILPQADQSAWSTSDSFPINFFYTTKSASMKILSLSTPLDCHLKNSPHLPCLQHPTIPHILMDQLVQQNISASICTCDANKYILKNV